VSATVRKPSTAAAHGTNSAVPSSTKPLPAGLAVRVGPGGAPAAPGRGAQVTDRAPGGDRTQPLGALHPGTELGDRRRGTGHRAQERAGNLRATHLLDQQADLEKPLADPTVDSGTASPVQPSSTISFQKPGRVAGAVPTVPHRPRAGRSRPGPQQIAGGWTGSAAGRRSG